MALVVMAKRWLNMESRATRTIGLVDVAGGAAETQLDASAVLLPLLRQRTLGRTWVSGPAHKFSVFGPTVMYYI